MYETIPERSYALLRERMTGILTKKVNSKKAVSKSVTFLKAYIFLNYKGNDISKLST